MMHRALRELFDTDAGLSLLLVSLVITLFGIYPIAQPAGAGRILVDIAVTWILILAAYSLSDRRGLLSAAILLGTAAIGFRWLVHLTAPMTAVRANLVCTLLFLALTTGGICVKVFRRGPVNTHRIQGAIAVYLMLGLSWAFAYALVESYDPDSFNFIPVAATVMGDLVHFSFVTLTTLGYGDIVPLTPSARGLAALEALTGQLYLTILVARLVGLHLTPQPRRED